jgi:hypothetical protein
MSKKESKAATDAKRPPANQTREETKNDEKKNL